MVGPLDVHTCGVDDAGDDVDVEEDEDDNDGCGWLWVVEVISWSDRSLLKVEIESFGYTMADLKYAWNDGKTSVKMSPDVSLPQFIVLGHR